MQNWPIHEAKARLTELVKRAQKQPQQLTSHGEPVAVVLSTEAYHRQHEGESLVAFIRRSPLVEAAVAPRNHGWCSGLSSGQQVSFI